MYGGVARRHDLCDSIGTNFSLVSLNGGLGDVFHFRDCCVYASYERVGEVENLSGFFEVFEEKNLDLQRFH